MTKFHVFAPICPPRPQKRTNRKTNNEQPTQQPTNKQSNKHNALQLKFVTIRTQTSLKKKKSKRTLALVADHTHNIFSSHSHVVYQKSHLATLGNPQNQPIVTIYRDRRRNGTTHPK